MARFRQGQRDRVQTEGIDYDGYTLLVTADIDISSAPWTPVGGQDYAFDGTFDEGRRPGMPERIEGQPDHREGRLEEDQQNLR